MSSRKKNDKYWKGKNWSKDEYGYSRPPVNLGAILSIRLTGDEWKAFGKAANAAGYKLRTAFLKDIALKEASLFVEENDGEETVP